MRRSQCTCEPRPGRHAVAEHLDDAAERVAGLRRLLDLADHVGLGVGVEAAHLGRVDLREVVGPGPVRGRRAHAAELDDVAEHRHVDLREQRPWRARPAATRAAVSRALARSSTSRASVNPYFCMPARSACPGRGCVSGFAVAPGADDISSFHLPVAHSLLRITIATGEPSVRPWRTPPRNSSSSVSNRMPRAAPVAEPAARELGRDVVDDDRQAGGQALDGDHQRRSVGLARRQEPQHGVVS